MNKYIVSQEFMNKLEEWRSVEGFLLCATEISILPDVVQHWWFNGNNKENNNRLIAIIRWVNGEDVFEVEKPKKWVVRSKFRDIEGFYWYVYVYNGMTSNRFIEDQATHFNTKEDAQEWANAHQEVIEVK